MKYVLCLYLCALSSLLNAQSYEEITLLKIPSGVLEGTLLIPDSLVYKNKLPLAFIIAGVGNKASQIIKEQLSAQPEFIQTLSEPILKQLQEGQLVEEVTPMLYALFRPSIQPYLISWFAIDPQEEIKKLNIPILILQGTTDIQVGIAEAELLSQANPRAKKVIIEGMNHILKPAALERAKNLATYQNPKLPIAPLLLQEIVTFIRKLE